MHSGEFWLWFTFLIAVQVVLLIVLWFRHRNQQMQHQERMAAIEKGAAVIPAGGAPWSPRTYLLRGLIWTFTGAAVVIGLLGLSWSSYRPHQPMSAEWQAMQARNVSQYLGVPIEQAREIVAKDEARRAGQMDGPSPAIALFGVIPLAVGLAYLVFYRSGASGPAGANSV